MSIIIEGIDVPTACALCPCLKGWRCGVNYRAISSDLLVFDRPEWCPIHEHNDIKTNVFDQVEEHPNCTVQILKNSVTGEISVGWYKNDS